MTEKQTRRISKFLSLVLRHQPQLLDLTLDLEGWVEVKLLLERMQREGKGITKEQLEEVVATNDKKRFAFNEDHTKIRASQGHSIAVTLAYESKEPPTYLYHGTPISNISSIQKLGLQKRKRHHVHLSNDIETATKVGARRGKPVVLTIQAQEMQEDGYVFYLSDNGVWLTDAVAPKYIAFKD